MNNNDEYFFTELDVALIFLSPLELANNLLAQGQTARASEIFKLVEDNMRSLITDNHNERLNSTHVQCENQSH